MGLMDILGIAAKERAEIDQLNKVIAGHTILIAAIIKKNGGRVTIKEAEMKNIARTQPRIEASRESYGVVYRLVDRA